MSQRLRSLRVDMEGVLDAMDRAANAGWVPHLDLDTGEVVPVPDATSRAVTDEDLEDADAARVAAQPRRYRPIPRIAPHEDEDLVAAFIHGVEDKAVRQRLRDASGHAAFVAQLGDGTPLRKAWERFRRHARLEEAGNWLNMLGIRPEYALAPEPAPSVPPTPVAPVPHLLAALLGDGERAFDFPDEELARRAALQWTAQAGVPPVVNVTRKGRQVRVRAPG